MRDDPLNNLAIVQAVKEVPELYDGEISISKAETERLWNSIGQKVCLSGIAARDRWRIIRGSYVRFHRTKDSPSGGPKKEYYLSKYMEFLRPYLKMKTDVFKDSDSASMQSPIESNRERQTKSSSHSRKRSRPEYKQEEVETITEELDDHLQEEVGDQEISPRRTPMGSLNFTLCNGRLVQNDNGPNVDLVEDLRTINDQTNPSPPDEEMNPDLMFFKSLLQDMATLSHKKKNIFKVTVLSALNDLMDD